MPVRRLPHCASVQWWATFRGVHRVLVVAKDLSQKLQYGGLMLNQQREVLRRKIDEFVTMGTLRTREQVTAEEAGDRRMGCYVMRPRWLAENARRVSPAFARGLSTVDTDEQRLAVAGAVGAAIVAITAYLGVMLHEYDQVNMPGVDPHSMATMDRDTFIELVRERKDQVQVCKGSAYTQYEEHLLTEFDNFAGTATVQGIWKPTTLKNKKVKEVPVLFRDMWREWRSDFPRLCEFAGLFATAYPGTTQVERHFSVLRGMYSKCRRSLSPMALEGCFHCRQYWELVCLASRVSRVSTVDSVDLSSVADEAVESVAQSSHV
eukprot:GHVU01034898.1.p1 GENE.GHVU01034898.1~~GHVU01034898.1.p1  ORF type:complete len:320 (+),score=40.81 GHVU01034898.1:497-1456(+)